MKGLIALIVATLVAVTVGVAAKAEFTDPAQRPAGVTTPDGPAPDDDTDPGAGSQETGSGGAGPERADDADGVAPDDGTVGTASPGGDDEDDDGDDDDDEEDDD